MSMLDRYKKKGGFLQLLLLIETSSKQKQEQFLNIIAQENPVWEEEIKRKTLTVDKILSWNSTYVSEVFSRVQPLTVAVATRSFTKEQVDKVMSCFTHSDQRKIQNIISETNPSPSEIQTCVMKLVAEVRELMKTGLLKMEKIDQEMVVPENIEEKLAQKSLMKSIEVQPEAAPLNFHTEEEKQKEKTKLAQAAVGSSSSENLREENEFLKRKVQQLSNENSQIKNELAALKLKIEQIKKIA